MHIPVVYQDADIVVVNKPAGVPTHAPDPADPYPSDALRAVQAELGLPYLGMHQRLDAETSGVLLFAARRQANAALAAAFESHVAKKTYLALVHGRPSNDSGTIDAPIVREQGERYRVTGPGDRKGRTAVTRYRVLQRDPSGQLSLLEVQPESGRTHQIRVHLAHLGVPVVGDRLYGEERSGPARLGLHAWKLELLHPSTGRSLDFTAPPPAFYGRVGQGLAALSRPATARPLALGRPDLQTLLSLAELASARRAPLADGEGTSIYRLANGAGDGMPELAADRYGDAVVLSLYDDTYAARMRNHDGASHGSDEKGRAPRQLLEALLAASGARAGYLKVRPRQASRVSEEDVAVLAPAEPAVGPAIEECIAFEDGLAYLLRPGEGWNPGLFPDMREMRGRVRAWAKARKVLNCFAYTCGFGVAATAGGAERVLNIDLAKAVLERGQANYRANGFAVDAHDFVYGDVFDWLGRLARRRDLFDMIILDPPGFARTKTRRFSAAQDYGELAELAARVLAEDGLLIAACNVAELSWRHFRNRVLDGLARTGRQVEVTGVYRAPGLDFPPEPGHESHLKVLAARVA